MLCKKKMKKKVKKLKDNKKQFTTVLYFRILFNAAKIQKCIKNGGKGTCITAFDEQKKLKSSFFC